MTKNQKQKLLQHLEEQLPAVWKLLGDGHAIEARLHPEVSVQVAFSYYPPVQVIVDFYGQMVGCPYPDAKDIEVFIHRHLGKAVTMKMNDLSISEFKEVFNSLPSWATETIRSNLNKKLEEIEEEVSTLQANLTQANRTHNHITSALDQIK